MKGEQKQFRKVCSIWNHTHAHIFFYKKNATFLNSYDTVRCKTIIINGLDTRLLQLVSVLASVLFSLCSLFFLCNTFFFFFTFIKYRKQYTASNRSITGSIFSPWCTNAKLNFLAVTNMSMMINYIRVKDVFTLYPSCVCVCVCL